MVDDNNNDSHTSSAARTQNAGLHWIFTWNNPGDSYSATLEWGFFAADASRYVYQLERGKSYLCQCVMCYTFS